MQPEQQAPLPSKTTKKDDKKKYCDRSFKNHLAKALKTNQGEPGNMARIMNHRVLHEYPSQQVINFTNTAAADVQKDVNTSIDDPRMKELLTMTHTMDHISFGIKPQELPLVMKLNSNNSVNIDHGEAQGISFDQLNKFLYTAVNGLVDFTEMNEPTKKVLYDTFNMLMEQVEKDAPNCLEDLKSKIATGYTEKPRQNIEELAKIFQDKSLNPLSMPLEFLLKGTIPDHVIDE